MVNGKNNSGKYNSGDWNSGDWNSGDWNSGYRNSGNLNSGDRNSGNLNSGDRNSGDSNSGNWNACGFSTGFFNTKEQEVIMFNKPTSKKREDIDFPNWFYFNLTNGVDESEMTKEEKQENPSFKTTSGFLKVFEYKQAWRNAFDEASKEEVEKALGLPNFDYKVFEEVTGISEKDFEDKLRENKGVLNEIRELKERIKELEKKVK